MKVLITAGGTRVPIDSVRHIGNMSSGYYGAILTNEFLHNSSDDVTLFIDKNSPHLCDLREWAYETKFNLETYRDYFDYLRVKELIKNNNYDVIISAAAVSDYIVDKVDGKISSDSDELVLKLRKGEKVIKSFKTLSPNSLVFGFKLLSNPTEFTKSEAIRKQLNYVDYVIYNDLSKIRAGNSERIVYDQNMTDYRVVSPNLLMKFIKQEYRNRIN